MTETKNRWSHRDVLRLSHAKPDSQVANFMLGKPVDYDAAPEILRGFAEMQAADSVEKVLRVLDAYKNLPWETIPTQFLTDARVWKALFYNGQLNGQALLRNVTRLAKIGAFKDVQFAGDFAQRLTDAEMIAKTKLHPINYANALGMYRGGAGSTSGYSWGYLKPSKDWDTNAKVLGALEDGFYASFKAVEPANKRTLISIDTSGSMTWHGPAGLKGMDCREAAAAMAMITVRTEPYVEIIGFGTSARPINISDKDSLETVQAKIDAMPAAGTDCAQPVLWSQAGNREFDTFVTYTDNETWAGRVHPHQALAAYRQKTGLDSRLAVVGMVSNGFSIADPQDNREMDFVGFDASAPRVLADFSAGRL